MTNAITAAAAVAAAIFSLVNVVLSNQFARTTQVQQWRRDSVRNTIAAFLDASRILGDAYLKMARIADSSKREPDDPKAPDVDDDAVRMRREEFIQAQQDAAEARKALVHLLGELELVASDKCVMAGAKLRANTALFVHPALVDDDDDRETVYWKGVRVVERYREEFVRACRVDLGVDRRRPRMFWFPPFRRTG